MPVTDTLLRRCLLLACCFPVPRVNSGRAGSRATGLRGLNRTVNCCGASGTSGGVGPDAALFAAAASRNMKSRMR